MNATAKVIGLDTAKNVFVAVGRDEQGKVVLKRTLSRGAADICEYAGGGDRH